MVASNTVVEPYKLNNAQVFCLSEALRRWQRFGVERDHESKSITEAWTGLGTGADYKSVFPQYMTLATGGGLKYDTWWKLTPEGAAIVTLWMNMGYTADHIENDILPPKDGRKLVKAGPVPYVGFESDLSYSRGYGSMPAAYTGDRKNIVIRLVPKKLVDEKGDQSAFFVYFGSDRNRGWWDNVIRRIEGKLFDQKGNEIAG